MNFRLSYLTNTMILLSGMIGVIVMFVVNIAVGSVHIPVDAVVRIILDELMTDGETSDVWRNIILKTRLPQAVTAVVAGAGLSVAGLEMQTVFRNPLAGPSVLGVSSGASLGVALLILLSGSIGGRAMSSMGIYGNVGMTVAAAFGAMVVMSVIAVVAHKVKGNVTLLIVGVMIGYIANAIIGVLKLFSPAEDIRAYTVWGMGSFSSVSLSQIGVFSTIMVVFLLLSVLMVKSLNILLLGDYYAQNLGLDVGKTRMLVILSSGLLVAVCTAFCGPVSFIGLSVPHLVRGVFRSSDHRVVMPGCVVFGALLALSCNLISRMPGAAGSLPVNSVTSLIGAPVVIWVIFRERKR